MGFPERVDTIFGRMKSTGTEVNWKWAVGRNKTLSPSTSLPVMGEIAGVNAASLGGYFHSAKTRAKWAEGFHGELNRHVFDLEKDGLSQVVPCQ